MSSAELLLCYNKGCGQKFVQQDNSDDSCCHHPGVPVFHDAYKGWSCCKKKCTDFTEFLNIKGCTYSRHNSVKPAEPEKAGKDPNLPDMVVYQAPEPLKRVALTRPPFDAPLFKLKCEVSAALQQELEKRRNVEDPQGSRSKEASGAGEVSVGTPCKNGGCKEVDVCPNRTYTSESSNDSSCCYHPGVPIFHEGLKYWSCCMRRTTDFQAFLNQEGCAHGNHNWNVQDDRNKTTTQCRHDWIQTGSHIVVNVYCKKYDPSDDSLTFVQVNPTRLMIQIYFPDNRTFYKADFELFGIINTVDSGVACHPSKVEVKLKKAEPMTWSRMNIARPSAPAVPAPQKLEDDNMPKVDFLDLSDL